MPKIKFDNGVVMTLDREPSSQEIEELGKIAMSQGRPPINQQLKSIFPEIPAEEQVKHPYLTAMAKTGRDVAAIPAHFANQFFLDYPRRVTEHFGYEYPSETKNITAGATAKIAGVAGGLKNPIFRAIGGVGQGLGKNILAGAATGLAYSPSKFESPLQVAGEQITKAIGGAMLPLAGKAITKVTPAIRGAGEYVFSKGAGLSRTTLNTFNRLGYGKIRNIARKGINYIQEDVIPRARQNLLKNITMAGDASKEILQDMGFNPDQIKDVMRISPDNMKKYGNLISQNWVKTEENISNALRTVGKQIGNVYTQAAKEGQRINVRNTLSVMRQQLKKYGMIDDAGNLLGDYKTHPSTSIRNLAQLYTDYGPRIGKGDISIPDFMNFRTRLEASITKVVENEKFNVPVYITRKALKEDSINSLMMKGSPYEKFWRGINKEYSDLETIDYLSKKINSVVNNLPEKIMTQRNKLTDKHLRLYGRDIVNDIDAYNAAKELYPEKETLGLFNFQKPLVRTALKATGVVGEAARPVTAPLGQAARNIGQFGASRLKQYIESPMISPSTQRMIQGKKGQISFGEPVIRGPITAAEAVKQGMGAEEWVKSKMKLLYALKIKSNGYSSAPADFTFDEIVTKAGGKIVRAEEISLEGGFLSEGGFQKGLFEVEYIVDGKTRFAYVKRNQYDIDSFFDEWLSSEKKLNANEASGKFDLAKIDNEQKIKIAPTKSQLLSVYEAAQKARGQNPLRNKSGQVFIGSGQEVFHLSRIYKILAQNPQETWTPQQLRGFLSGKVSQNELDTLLTPELMAKPKITKADVLQSIEKNMPQTEVVRKGEKISKLPEFIDYKGEKTSNIGSIQLGIKFESEANQYRGSILTNRGFDYVWGNTEAQVKSKMVQRLNSKFPDLMKSQELTKFSQYQFPGGSNYQETLIKVPTKEGISSKGRPSGQLNPNFFSPHFDEPNVLAHVRHNDRVTLQGEKVRFLEEIQSDWATTRRKHLEMAAEEGLEVTEDIIPSHPLLKNWQELTLKQALKDAAESDAKYLSWTTGEQQAGRYDLSKQVDSINWFETAGVDKKSVEIKIKNQQPMSLWIDSKGKVTNTATTRGGEKVIGKNITEIIGKDHAEKIVSQPKGNLSGEDLKIGGEWAKNLYDKQIPNILKKLTGQDVEMIKFGLGKNVLGVTKYGEKPLIAEQLQPAIRLTPELKAQIKSGKGKIAELFNVGMLGPTAATGIGLAAALKATSARAESGESLDPQYKQQIANAENYRKTTGDWAQLEDIALRDLKRIGKLKQNITLKQVKADPQLYDKVAKLYWDRLDAFGIPDKDKALWWLMPGRYRQTGGDISRLKNPEHRNIMQNRVKNIRGRK